MQFARTITGKRVYTLDYPERLKELKGVTTTVCHKCTTLYAWHGDQEQECPICNPGYVLVPFTQQINTLHEIKYKLTESLKIVDSLIHGSVGKLSIFRNENHHKNGVFVDVSFRKDQMQLAIVCVQDTEIRAHRLKSNERQSTAAELEAVNTAKWLYPNETIHCDDKNVAEHSGVTYIPRKQNKLAHDMARKTK